MGKKTVVMLLGLWVAAATFGLSSCQAEGKSEHFTVQDERAEALKEWEIPKSTDDPGDAEPSVNGGTEPVMEACGRYVYETLDEETKRVYDEIYQALMAHEETIRVDTLDIGVLDLAYKAVNADNGEIFWASGYVYTQYTKGDTLVGIDFAPKYTMTLSERNEIQQQITAAVFDILSGVSMDTSDYEKTKYVFEYLASNVDYEIGVKENQNIISVFLYKKTVCQGYASATQYLLSQLGIRSAVVTGTANGNSHAWNLALLDGDYYYIDTTWGNSAYASENSGMKRFINYNYFCVTSKEMELTHSANDDFTLPDCVADRNNYYIREGWYFSEWDTEAIGSVYRAAYNSGQSDVSIKFASAELYEKARDYFITQQGIADYCSGITSLYYVEDLYQNVLTLNFS